MRGGVGHTQLPISRTTLRDAIVLALLTVGATAVLTGVLHRFTDSSAPLADAVTTALSLTAQYMLSRKLLENWWVWMTADVIYVVLYCYKSLYLTGVLYVVFFAMCVAGFRSWQDFLMLPVAKAKAEAPAL